MRNLPKVRRPIKTPIQSAVIIYLVALMFGFEAFECSGGKAEAGKFGYYLRKVRI